MATTKMICADCSIEFIAQRKNTKRCPVCRLVNDLQFIGTATQECWLCEEQFAPLTQREEACGNCCYQPQAPGTTACLFCSHERKRVREGVAICHVCARKPENRRDFLKLLKGDQREQLARLGA